MMLKKLKVALPLLTALFIVIITTVSASAAVNPQINFQGKLTNPDGTNIANGSYTIRYRIYTDPTLDAANTCSANTCKWEESKSITVTDGVFQTALGDTTALPGSVDFNTSALYLGIKVGTDPEMTPRVRLTASPYAFNSDKVGGLSVSQLVQLSPASQQTGSINVSGAIATASTLTVNTNALNVSAAGNTSLGSTNDIYKLDINGSERLQPIATAPTAAKGVVYFDSVASKFRCSEDGSTYINCVGAGGGASSLQGAYTGGVNGIIALSSTVGGILIRDNATPIGGNLFVIQNSAATATFLGVTTAGLFIQDSSGVNAFALDSSTHTLKVYDSTGANYASVSYVGGTAIFAASSGATQFGNGSGDISGLLSSPLVKSTFTHTATVAAGPHQVNDFTITRNLTGTSFALQGAVLKVEDTSTITTGSSSPDLLLINQSNATATGNLLNAQLNGVGKFSVTTAGNLNASGTAIFTGQITTSGGVSIGAGQSYTSVGAVTLSSGGANTLTLDTGGAAAINIGGTNATSIVLGGNAAATITQKVANASTTAYNLQTASGTALLVGDTTNTKLKVGGGDITPDANPVVLVVDHKSSASGTTDPAGVNGAIYYNEASNTFRCYENGVWSDCLSHHVIALGSDVINNNATACTLADVTGLSFAVAAGKMYRFHANIIYTAPATTTGSLWSVNGPATPTIVSYAAHYGLSAGETAAYASAFNSGTCSATSTATADTSIVEGIVQPSAAGTFTVRFASEVASSAITAKAGSTLEWW